MRISSGRKRRPVFRQPEPPPPPRLTGYIDRVLAFLSAIWIPLFVFLMPLVIFWPTLSVGFVSDDYLYHGAFTDTFADFLRKAAMMHGGELSIPEFFRPIGIISLRLDYMIWGDDPVGFHLTNILLHSLNAVLLFFIFGQFGLRKAASAMAALLFAVYPLSSEPVAWVSGRFDLLAATFTFLTLLAWCASRLRNDVRLMIPAIVFFLLGILSKENAAAGIVLLPIADTIINIKTKREWGTGTGWLWQWYVIFAAIVVIVVGFRLWYFGDIGGYSDETNRATYLSVPFSTLLDNLVSHDFKMLMSPISSVLWADWNPAIRQGLIAVGILLWAGLAISLSRSVVKAWRTDESDLALIVGGILWALFMMLPTLSISPVMDSLNCSRFLYLSVAGLALWAGVAADCGFRTGNVVRNISVVVMVLILGTSIATLRQHNRIWIEAGGIASRINTVMETHTADLPDNAVIFTVNYPLLWKGASCAPLKYEWYVDYLYGKKNASTIEMRMEPDEIDSWWEGLAGNYARPGIGFVWDEADMSVRLLPMFIPSGHGDEITEEEIPLPEPVESEVSTVEGEESVTESNDLSTSDEVEVFPNQ